MISRIEPVSRLSRSRPRWAFLAGVLVLGVSLGLLLPKYDSVRNPRLPGLRPLEALFDVRQPLLIPGQRVQTFGEARAALAYPLIAPAQLTPSEIWVSPTGESGLRFGSTLVETILPIPVDANPLKVYQAQARDWGFGYVDLIAGNPAWIVPDHPNSAAPGVNTVRVARNGVEIRLYSRMPVDNLVSIAASLTVVAG